MSRKTSVHVFTGTFPSREEACLYSEEQWEDEPGEDVSDEDYEAWEDRNPTWKFGDDLGGYLDHDFIETIEGDFYAYLEELLENKEDLEAIKGAAMGECNTLVLVFDRALEGLDIQMKSTPLLTYAGEYTCQ